MNMLPPPPYVHFKPPWLEYQFHLDVSCIRKSRLKGRIVRAGEFSPGIFYA